MPPAAPALPTLRLTRTVLWVWLLASLGQLLLALNPGYFSHDELQWGAAAGVAQWRDLPWVDWWDVAAFQWRPLTFNLWLLISHALFETPVAFHALWVALGSGVAAALALLLRRLGASHATAVAAGAVFALGPYAVYVHGWVGTLADLLWVGCALALAHVVLSAHQRGRTGWTLALTAFALTALALMAKEAAVAMPALLAAVWLCASRSRAAGVAAVGSGAAALIYLALRWSTLMHAPEPGPYAVSLAFVPGNLARFALFPLRVSAFELQGFESLKPASTLAAALVWLGLLWGLFRRSPRMARLLVLGSVLALAPALPLATVANQYAYGASAWAVACVALAWPDLGRAARALVCLLALVLVWHGANVQREMRRVGERQAVFQPALAEALRTHDGVLTLHAPPDEAWQYRRFTHQVPSWGGVAVGERVAWTDDAATADALVQPDGQLQRR
jgi:hypothetical protein